MQEVQTIMVVTEKIHHGRKKKIYIPEDVAGAAAVLSVCSPPSPATAAWSSTWYNRCSYSSNILSLDGVSTLVTHFLV